MAGRVKFTAKEVSNFKCPPGKGQAFLWDATITQLGLRVTPNGEPSYIFQGRFHGTTPRITIGSPKNWSIKDARAKAREYQRYIDEGRDPRIVVAEQKVEEREKRRTIKKGSLTGWEAWNAYLKDRQPQWGDQHYADHQRMSKEGGEKRKNKKGAVTRKGVLVPLLDLKLSDLTEPKVRAWAIREVKRGSSQARLAFRLLKAFINWCELENDYQGLIDSNIVKSVKIRDILGKQVPKKDHLQKEQLETWFKHIKEAGNPAVSIYLEALLVTGARPSEMLNLKWDDIDFQWASISIGDKVDDIRDIPLTPYLASQLISLPRRNQWVFSSDRSSSGRIDRPNKLLAKVCKSAGLPHLTLHGLRRSFKNLTEWLEVPVGVVAQIMGHKPSATAEKHYTERPIDLLRIHHVNIEAWILEQARVEFNSSKNTSKLRLVE
ncbi:hypothetical protein BOV89_12210 [Solemya velum gill symbiont]|uniref:tyrosine-type recombinase/integrase n=2 Tax=Solemya velum gill symbiont TaxID=2340 RepID=UPI000998E47A|nr:integrase family protein [Solemya velum gill symbiont]OOY36507.1 hypothetical protein BOV89_12210 [Solemya velum gill symbiont]